MALGIIRLSGEGAHVNPLNLSSSAVATKFRYGPVAGIPSPPLEERARERRPFVSKFGCHDTRTSWLLAGFLLSSVFCQAQEPSAIFKAGAAKRDITPKEPVPMWGYGA